MKDEVKARKRVHFGNARPACREREHAGNIVRRNVETVKYEGRTRKCGHIRNKKC